MEEKEVTLKAIDVSEIRDIAIKLYVDKQPLTNYANVEALVNAVITYCGRHHLIIRDGKVFKKQ